jgi:uncharacterized protein (DUF1697 family)
VRYAAFLRGINVTGRRVKGPQLCAPLEDIGLEDVRTFRASGNLVFTAGQEPVARLTKRVEAALEAALGYDVAVFVRNPAQLRAISDQEPFAAAQHKGSAGKLQVSLLARLPTPARRRQILALATESDPLAFGERELYWLPRGGMMESELDVDALDRLLGPTTRRTMGTIETMAAKFFAE